MKTDKSTSPPLLPRAPKQQSPKIIAAAKTTTTTTTTTNNGNNNNNNSNSNINNNNNNNTSNSTNNNSNNPNNRHHAANLAQAYTTTTTKTTTTTTTAHSHYVNSKNDKKNLHDMLLETLDIMVSCLVVAPCVIGYWRGTWELMGVLIFPDNTPLSALMSFLIGGFGHLTFTMTQAYFKNHIHPDKSRLTYYVFSRCYTALFGIVCVNMWRGSWILCDWLTSADSLIIIIIVTLVAVLFLIATRTVRNLGAAPYTVTMDHKSDYFEVDTMFRIPGFHQPGLYVLDSLFSIFVIGTLVVIAWRGVWGIMDLTLFPQQKAKSAWGSLVIGYVTVFLTFTLQPLIRIICKHIDGIGKLIVCDIFYFMTFFGAVNAWRGIWTLLDVYLYPDNPILSFWLTHVICFLILAALKCSNSILIRGVFIDAEEPGGNCVDVPINYIRLHFQRERMKKHHAMQYYTRQHLHPHHQQQQQLHHNLRQQEQHHLAKNMELEAHTVALIDKPKKVEIKPMENTEPSAAHLV